MFERGSSVAGHGAPRLDHHQRVPAPDNEEAWERFLTELERTSGDYGPVLSREAPDVAQVVMSANIDDVDVRAQLSGDLVTRVSDALGAVDLGALYPTAIEIELAI